MIPKNWKDYLVWLLSVAVIILSALLAKLPLPPLPPPPPPIWTPGPDDMGWVADPEAVQEVMAELRVPVFALTGAGKSDDPIPKEVFLWQLYKQLDAKGPPTKNQASVGSCVSFGTNNAILRTMAVEIVIFKQPFELKDICEEVTYAGSRVEIGKGRIRGDGSVGAWAAKFVNQWGVVPREKVGKYDLSSYDTSRCRSWGTSGVPDDLEPEAKLHPVQSITLLSSWADAKKALASGYGIAICSNRGFRMQRDARGVASPSGSWAHCMCLDGYYTDENGQEYGHIENSWGPSAHTGPVGWGTPSTAGFWAESRVIEAMIKAGDSWAFSSIKGFPRRELDWFVRQALPRDRVLARVDPFGRFYHASAN